MKVLLIEDEPKMVRSLRKGLEEHLIDVDTASDGPSGQALAERNDYSVIISDVILPGLSGLELLHRLRSKGNRTPVILLTALDQTDDKVSGFEAGADDYLTKPFEFRELLVRLRALARRPVETYQSSPVLRFAEMEMNLETKEFFREGQKIALTPREFSLMEFLMTASPKPVSKAAIIEHVWDQHFDSGTNVVNVYVKYLRRKIDRNGLPPLLQTIRGVGFALRPAVS